MESMSKFLIMIYKSKVSLNKKRQILISFLFRLINNSDEISKQHKTRTQRSIKDKLPSYLTDYLRYQQVKTFQNIIHHHFSFLK